MYFPGAPISPAFVISTINVIFDTGFFADAVFNLPQGYTVNSLQAGIVDNTICLNTVPVPAALPLILSALAGLGLIG